jgi:hypothetical protein
MDLKAQKVGFCYRGEEPLDPIRHLSAYLHDKLFTIFIRDLCNMQLRTYILIMKCQFQYPMPSFFLDSLSSFRDNICEQQHDSCYPRYAKTA